MRAFFSSVHRPTMLSPAKWITASNPETASGEIGCEGFHMMRSSLGASACAVPLRANRTTCAPAIFRDGTSTEPTRPDAPLTNTRAIRRFTIVPTLAERKSFGSYVRDYKRDELHERKTLFASCEMSRDL